MTTAAAPAPNGAVTPAGGRGAFVAINAVGGTAVLASYVLWLGNPSNDAGALWGTIGGFGRALYTASMLTAAAGYFAFAPFLLRHGDRAPLSFHRVNVLFVLVLLPSALWMPLAFEYLDAPGDGLWATMRAGLLLTGLASAAIIRTVAAVPADVGGRARTWALAGAVAFTLQTLVLDALVWPRSFPA
ncbi:MAG: hypothetical protein FJ148_18525 [Deltaproteobacteria bacterium]|nr:hypothetical protein [Deltaproteobacteria bacterium]